MLVVEDALLAETRYAPSYSAEAYERIYALHGSASWYPTNAYDGAAGMGAL